MIEGKDEVVVKESGVVLEYDYSGHLAQARLNGKEIFSNISSNYNDKQGYTESPNRNIVEMVPGHIEQYDGQDMRWDGKQFNIELDRGYPNAEGIAENFHHISLFGDIKKELSKTLLSKNRIGGRETRE